MSLWHNNGNSATVMQLHSKEIERFPLLTPEGEVALCKRIERGDQAARDQLVLSNMRLVRSIASKYQRTLNFANGMDLVDLMQEGYIGLMTAADRFDCRTGNKFSTYATWWIRAAISRALQDQANTIRLPVYVVEESMKIHKVLGRLAEQGKTNAKPREIAQLAGVAVAAVKRVSEYDAMTPVSIDQLTQVDTPLHEVVRDASPDPEQSLVQKLVRTRVHEMVQTLEPRLAKILVLRFGLEDSQKRTLDEVAEVFDLSYERIRQLEKKGLAELHKAFGSEAREYVGLDLGFSEPKLPVRGKRKVRASSAMATPPPKAGRRNTRRPRQPAVVRGSRHSALWYVKKLQALAKSQGDIRGKELTLAVMKAKRPTHGFDSDELYDHFETLKEAFTTAGLSE